VNDVKRRVYDGIFDQDGERYSLAGRGESR